MLWGTGARTCSASELLRGLGERVDGQLRVGAACSLLFGVGELSVPLLKQRVPVFVGAGAWPKHADLYVEGMCLVYPACRHHTTSTARFRGGAGSLAGPVMLTDERRAFSALLGVVFSRSPGGVCAVQPHSILCARVLSGQMTSGFSVLC